MTLPSYALTPRRRLADSAVSLSAASASGAIDANGVRITRADQFVARTGTRGAGVTVGVQSVGVSSVSIIQGRGELPMVRIVTPADGAASPAGDEGTALLEEVHAVAPAASLAYCGPQTFVEYSSCLSQMVAVGATILVDDIIFTDQDLLSSDSPQVQGIEQLLAANPTVALFTAAGNYNGSYWEGNYDPVALSSLGLPALTCPLAGGQTDAYVSQFAGSAGQKLTVTQSSSIPIALAWSDPPDRNSSKFDVYWLNGADNTKSGCLPTAAAAGNQVSQHVTLQAGSYTLYIASPDAAASGKFLKLWVGGDGLTSLSKPTSGAIVTPQAFASGSMTIGAVNGSDGVGGTIESFSSVGPVSVSFPKVAHIQAPVLVAPDGINVDAAGTYFASSLFPDGNFYGTSAAAPNAAAVAALIRGAFPFLTASQLAAALQSGAVVLGASLPDPAYGYGRIDALGALATFPEPTITALPDSSLQAGAATPSVEFSVSGTGPLHFKVASTNTTVVPAALVAAGNAGVSITPADCGTAVLTCTVSVMAAKGPGGTVKVTLSALDGANRSASALMTLTVTGSSPSTPSATPMSTPGGGGGMIDGLFVASLLATWMLKHARRTGSDATRGSTPVSPGGPRQGARDIHSTGAFSQVPNRLFDAAGGSGGEDQTGAAGEDGARIRAGAPCSSRSMRLERSGRPPRLRKLDHRSPAAESNGTPAAPEGECFNVCSANCSTVRSFSPRFSAATERCWRRTNRL
jgi:hypothetical protein